MSKAKLQAAQQQGSQPSSGSFASGFLLGQLTLALISFCFIKFFIFGDASSADVRAAARASSRRQRTLSHARQRTLSSALLPRPSSGVVKHRNEGGLTAQKILEKTYYQVHGHQPESLDWFNVLVAQTIAQLRADAQEDEAVLSSLTALLNGPSRPDFVDEIRVTEISLGDEFPIFSNCRVIPVDENGTPIKELKGNRGEMLQARMDVDLSDVVTLGVETKLVVNYPKPSVLALPVALAVSVVRFSGTLAVSFSPSSQQPYPSAAAPATSPLSDSSAPPPPPPPQTNFRGAPKNEGHPLNPTGKLPTTLTFTFLDDYRLDLSVHSLIGSRSKLQDVPKIAQLVEDRIHRWFDERCVEPRFQQIVLPSLWPRKRNTRGRDDDGNDSDSSSGDPADITRDERAHMDGHAARFPASAPVSKKEGPGAVRAAVSPVSTEPATPAAAVSKSEVTTTATTATVAGATPGQDITAEQRTRDWAAAQQHGKTGSNATGTAAAAATSTGRDDAGLSELDLAGREMREADEREAANMRKRLQRGARADH